MSTQSVPVLVTVPVAATTSSSTSSSTVKSIESTPASTSTSTPTSAPTFTPKPLPSINSTIVRNALAPKSKDELAALLKRLQKPLPPPPTSAGHSSSTTPTTKSPGESIKPTPTASPGATPGASTPREDDINVHAEGSVSPGSTHISYEDIDALETEPISSMPTPRVPLTIHPTEDAKREDSTPIASYHSIAYQDDNLISLPPEVATAETTPLNLSSASTPTNSSTLQPRVDEVNTDAPNIVEQDGGRGNRQRRFVAYDFYSNETNTTDMRNELEEIRRRSLVTSKSSIPSSAELKTQALENEIAASRAATERAQKSIAEREHLERELREQERIKAAKEAELVEATKSSTVSSNMAEYKGEHKENIKLVNRPPPPPPKPVGFATRLQTVDIAFVLDCTSSMGRWITLVKERIFGIIQGIRSRTEVGDIRVGFVGYRDYFDPVRLMTLNFTSDIGYFQKYITPIKPFGGGDIPEDLLGGIEQALQLDWKANTRCMIVIADAPCHGQEFHDFEEDPRNFKIEIKTPPAQELMQMIRRANIDLSFTRITTSTNKMLEKFSIYYNYYTELGPQRTLNILELGNNVDVFVPQIINCVTASVFRRKHQKERRPIPPLPKPLVNINEVAVNQTPI